jgi:hypothetical protein
VKAIMPRDFDLKSPLYWLCGAFALGLLLIGLLALIAPHNAAALFGMPVTTIDALPWVRLAGIRDIALSLMLLAIMAMKAGRIAGILILLMPRLLNFIVALYLILVGLIGLFGLNGFHLH